MSTVEDVNKVIRNIERIYERKKTALYALSLNYAAIALQDLRREQGNDKYWENQTFTAVDSVFSDAFFDSASIGWLIAHGVEYGIDLELANNGKHQALKPTINKYAKQFIADAKQLMGG